MIYAAIYQAVSACIAICYTDELVSGCSNGRVEHSIVGCRDRAPNVHLSRGPDLNRNELRGLLKEVIGIKNRHWR